MASLSQGKFLKLPQTRLGWWAAWLSIIFVKTFLPTTSSSVHLPGMLIMAFGISGGILIVLALAWRKERSRLLWLLLLPGLFAIWFTAGELFYPH
ncbi:MAG TPA: hypothetical protein VGK00_02345 [Anaerolineales bacterium]